MSEIDPHPGRLEEIKRGARILRIIQLVSSQPRRWTRRQLAEQFELSERMIDKDLEIIRNGLCYDLQRAREGYCSTGGPLLKPIEMTVPEVLALALAAQQARGTGMVDVSVIGGVLVRLDTPELYRKRCHKLRAVVALQAQRAASFFKGEGDYSGFVMRW